MPELDWDSCAMLSAIAFERLLRPNATAQGIAEEFAKLWIGREVVTVAKSKRVTPDHNPKWKAAQMTWPLHRKWMKELYELRSAKVHLGPHPDLTSNWQAWQHVVIAAFTFTHSIKLALAREGLYTLSDDEEVHTDKLDALLDSDWGHGWEKPPEWPSILSEEKATRAIHKVLVRAYEKATRAS
jgi:hypothetical protein